MREQRWVSKSTLTFKDVGSLNQRLVRRGLKSVPMSRDIICYVEEWRVDTLEDFNRISSWPTEDVTLVHTHDAWAGDFYLLAGNYHTIYRKYHDVGTYCSVSHPFFIDQKLHLHKPDAMFWIGFRDTTHSFLRVRLDTSMVVTPGETREDYRRDTWIDERQRAFQTAINLADLPIQIEIEKGSVVLRTHEERDPFFCSWPDAFGPCQFEYNSFDVFQLLVPASRMASTVGGRPVTVRAYLTGFSETALREFQTILGPGGSFAFRCSVHCTLEQLPQILKATAPSGRLYATICEFQTKETFRSARDVWVIIGVIGTEGGFKVEARLNHAPYPEDQMSKWIEQLTGLPVVYSPLLPFP